MKTRKPSRRSRSNDRRSFFEKLWNVQPQKRARRSLNVEQLEDRRVMAVLYVDNPADYLITTDQGAVGLDNGDTVTWNAGAGTEHAPASVVGLTFGTNAFSTIQSAVNTAVPTDTIRVAGGTFSELVNVNKQLFLLGNQVGDDARDGRVGDPETIVDAAGLGGAFSISASDVVIDGFTVQGQTAVFPGAGIWMQPGTAGTEVRNNIVQNNVVGIYVSNNSAGNQTVIERNLFQNNTNPGAASGHDIYADQFTAGAGMQNVLIDSNAFTNTATVVNSWALGISNTNVGTPFTNITFSNNVVTNHGRGVYFYNTDGATVSGNEITGATNYAIGIFTFSGPDNNANIDILNNKLSNNNRGVWVDGYAGILDVTDNDLSGNATAGIQNDDADATINAEYNWWGSATGPTTPNNPGGTGSPITGTNSAGVDFSPYFTTGVDTQPGTPGFQGDFANVANAGPANIVGTNGDDQITIIARDASTHLGADGIQDFTVSVNGGPEVLYLNVATISVFALSGNDKIVVRTTAAVWDVDVNIDGGAPNASDQVEVGTAGADTVIYTPTGLGTGTLEITNLATTVNLIAGIEHLIYDGLGGGDSLTVDTTAIDGTQVLTPFTSFDEGLLEFQDGIFIATPLKFEGLGNGGSLTLLDIGRFDNLIYRGTDLDDTFGVDAAGQVTLNNRIPVNTPSIITLTLAGLDGDDTFNIVGNHNLPAISVEGGDPSASDVLNVTANTATIDFATNQINSFIPAAGPISLSGVERVRLDGTVGVGDGFSVLNYGLPTSVTSLELFEANQAGIRTGDAPFIQADTLRFSPFTNRSARMERAEGGPVIDIIQYNPDASVELGAATQAADDRLEVIGGHDTDEIRAFRTNAAGDAIQVNTTLAIGTLDQTDGVRIIFQTSVESLALVGRSGADTFVIDEVNGLLGGVSPVASTLLRSGIVVDGGDGSDALEFTGAATVSAAYSPGPNPGEGFVTHSIAANIQSVHFYNLEPVLDAVPGSLVINANNADNAINYSQGAVAANGLVSIDAQETYEFTAKTTLTINGLAGDDTINLNNPTTPTGLTGITVNGGDPTASDTVIVNGTAGADVVTIGLLTADGALIGGLVVPIVVTTTEHLIYSGQGGDDDLTYTASSESTLTPGATPDAGSITSHQNVGTTLLPVDYQWLGTGGSVTMNVVSLDVVGTDNDDQFDVDPAGIIEIFKPTSGAPVTVPIDAGGAAILRLLGRDGDDIFDIVGNHPFVDGLRVEGGNPSASDVLNFTGSGVGAVTVDFGAATVREGIFGPVSFSGVEILNAIANNTLTMLTTDGDDTLAVTPTGLNAATAVLSSSDPSIGATPVVNGSVITTLSVDLGLGSDHLIVNGNESGQPITVTGALVTVGALETVNYTNAENLSVNGQAGSDTFNVTPSATTSIFIDGGDPIGVLPGDVLNIVGGGAATFIPGPEADEGGFSTVGNQPISFDHIESISAAGGGGIIINGTNGNDVITIIARDASTHVGADGILDFTVSVNGGPSVLFLNTPAVTVNALAGDDIITVRTPAPNDAVWAVTVNIDGGEALPSASGEQDEVRIETPYLGSEIAVYTPTGLYSGGVLVADLATVINLTDVFAASYDGFQDGDDLVVLTPNAVIEPGSDPGSGVIHPVDAAGNPLLNLTYRNVSGLGSSVLVDGTTAVVQGTAENDVITVDAAGIVTVTNELGFSNSFDASNFDNLVINALGGDDQVTIAAGAPFLTIDVLGGDNGDGSDELNYNGAAGVGLITVETDLKTVTQTGQAVVSFDGIEDLNIDAALNPVDINGSLDDDSFIVRPNDATGAEVQQVGLNTIIQVNNTLDLEIDGDNGVGLENTLTIVATAGNDQITLNANQIAVAGRLPIQYSDIQALRVEGRAGTDRLTVDVTAGFPTNGGGNPIPITFDGQDGLDTLVISGVPTQPVDEVIYGPGPLANTGRVRYENAANTTLMTIDFVNLEPVIDLVAAANLTVNGTNADNAINYSLDEEIVNDVSIDTGLVSVDGFETIEFANKTNLNLNGLSGSDVINLGALGTPAGLTTVNVDGGDPTESDQLIVNGLFGGSTIDFAPTASDGGSVSVSALPITNYIRTELVTYVGRSGGDLLTVTSPVDGAEITYVPGATMDSGTVTQVGDDASSSLTPLEFRALGVLSVLTFATTGGVRSSGLDIQGTNNDDQFDVNALGEVQIVKANFPAPVTPTIRTPGVAVVRLLGLEGDDIFNIPGVHPIPLGIVVEGGDPSASDVLNFIGTGIGDIVVDLAAHTITEGANPPVEFTGIEIVNLAAAGASVLVNGSAGVDDVTISPTGADALTFVWEGHNTVWNVSAIDDFDFDGLGNDDELRVVYTSASETIDVDGPAGNVDDGTLQDIDFINFESLEVFGEEGNDTFNVTPAVGLPIFIDGGDPIGTTAGDEINIVGGGPNTFEPGPESDEGGFVFGLAARVSFDHIEAIAILNEPCVIILGTNGDDDITIIARDASYDPLADGVGDFTVSINGGPDILYVGVTMLYVDALAGDDDIVLRTPAPNNAVWDVDVFIAGGSPSAPTGDQGDVFQLETPGTQAVVFTPTGSDSGTILIDDNDDGIIDATETLITLGTFIDACPPVNYDSSSGGIELFVYEGETGGDTLTVVGDDLLNERFIHTPGSAPDAGRVDIHLGLTARLGVTYQNLGALGTIEIYGGGALPDFDTVVAMGTGDSDSMALDFLAINEAEITLSSAAGTYIDLITEDIEFYELRTLEGDDTIRIQAPITVAVGGNVSVFAGGPGGSDVLLLSGDAATIETVTISPDATNPLDQDVNGLGALINVSGVELLRYTGATGNGPNDTLIINPGAGDHWLRVDNAPTSGDRVLSDSLPEIQFDGLLTFRIIEGGTGNIAVTFVTRNLNGAANYETDLGAQDTLIIEGDDGAADDYTVIQDIATGDVVITDNAFGVTVRDLDTNVGRLQVNTLGGDDDLLVNVDGPVSGAIAVPLTYDGGLGSDLITISGTPTTALGADAPFTSVTYTPGPAVTEGRLAYDGLIDMLIDFLNLEPVIDLVGALSLIVNGTNADNAINYSLTPGGNGLVSVDGFETIEFANKVDLTLRGNSGSDVINIAALGTPAGLTSVTVEGGNPTDSDQLIVNGLFGGSTVNFAPITADQGSITVATLPVTNYSTIESVLYIGRSAGDLLTVTAPAGGSEISFVPGATEDSGFVTQHGFNQNSALTPFEFRNLGGFGELTFETAPGGTRLSGLQIHGTENDDVFVVDSTGDVVVVKSVLAAPVSPQIHTPGVAVLRLLGLNGDDAFNIPGNHPFPLGINVQGGDPSASDVLAFTASAGGLVTVDLGAQTVTQTGFGPVSYSGVEIIDLVAGGAGATTTIVASANDDDLTVTAFSATAGQVEIGLGVQQSGQVDPAIVAPLILYSNLGTPGLAVDMAGGEDTLVVVGNALAQNWVVDALLAGGRSVSIDDVPNGVGNDGLVTLTNTESLEVFGLEGNDAFLVIAGEIPVFVDGGDPIGVPPGDSIFVVGAIGLVFEGPEVDEGGFITGPGGVVSFDHIESLIVGPNGPCPFLILGTNGDDDITVIARDATYIIPPALVPPGLDGIQDFTVTINAGPEVLFIDEPDLFIDALAGDDDIVIRAPAPNDVDWDVNVRVAGGPPSIGEPNDGDRLVLETPGFDILEFRPTGPDTGSLVINEDGVPDYQAGGTDSIITFGPFVFVCDDPLGPPIEFTYNSSPGGVELVEYDGELTAGAAADDITIFGTALNDTTTVDPTGVGPGGSGQGNFVSPGSPLFNFRGFDALTVNGGTGGFDHVIYNATEGPDVITSDADSILLLTTSVTLDAEINKLTLSTLGGDDNVNLDLTIGGVNLAKTIDAGAGNDTVDLSGSIDADIFGGIGNDILIGSPASDNIFGGDGNDRIVGGAGVDFIYGEAGNDIIGDLFLGGDGLPNTADDAVNGASDDAGNDFFYGGDGSDLFIWEPGDGNDTIEGGANESDRVLFQGNAAGTAFTFNAGNGNVGGTRVEFLFGAGVDLDIAGVEEFDLNTLAGADTVTVNDLTQTDLRFIDIDLFVAAGDADSVIVNGRAVSDQVDIAPLPAPNGAIVAITGLAYDIRISGATAVAGPGGDLLTFNGNAGNDTIVSNDALNTLFAPEDVIINGGDGDDFISGFGTLNGDAGNDSLLGGAFVNVINGGAGNDFISGGGGGDDLNGDAGEDTFLADFDGVLDSYDGGTEFDTILIQATSGNDRIDAIQDNPTQIRFNVSGLGGGTGVVGGAGTQADALVEVGGVQTVEELKIVAGSGDDTIRVAHADSLVVAGFANDMLRFTVDGGLPGASDRLTVSDLGAGDTTVHRVGGNSGDGSYTMYSFLGGVPAAGIVALPPVVYTGIEFASLNPIDPVTGGTGTGFGGKLYVFKHDPFEENNSILNATHLGANDAINVDPVIDPGPDAPFNLPGDEDWYRVVAETTGTIDFQVYFREQGTLPNGRAGLPGEGDLQLFAYDAQFEPILGFGGNESVVGVNDQDERIRIPVVAGQTYYFRLNGAGDAINIYNLTVLNEAPPVPYDLELDDRIVAGAVAALGTTTTFNSNLDGQFPDDFFNGRVVSFKFDTTTVGIRGEEAVVLDYVGATGVFTLAFALSQAPAAGDTFQVESIDTGRSNTDNITRDNTPIIYLRLDDAIFLHDLPGNPVNDTPPDQVIPIPFNPQQTADPTAPGFRIAIFDEGQPTQPGQLPQVPIGYARQVAEGIYVFDFGIDAINPLAPNGPTTSFVLADGSHFLSAKVQIVDPNTNFDTVLDDIVLPIDPFTVGVQPPTGFGDRSVSLEINVDTVEPPVSFGDPGVVGDGLTPDSDTSVLPNPHTINDGVTSDQTPTFWGRAEADATVRLFVDTYRDLNGDGDFDFVDVNGDGDFDLGTDVPIDTLPDGVFQPNLDVFIGQDTSIPLDGNQQEPNGFWKIESVINFSDPLFFPTVDGLRTVFVVAEDVAGNVNDNVLPEELEIFLDIQGPQITDVEINNIGNPYDLFDPKPSNDGPTPLINSIFIRVQDLPLRVPPAFLIPAIKEDIAENPGHYLVIGDYNGIIPILAIDVINNPVPNPAPLPGEDPFLATATIEIIFRTEGPDGVFNTSDDVGIALPDDRFTLSINDEGIRDYANNILDGESNADEPHDQDNPVPPILGVDGFPTGDGIPGGDFIARFTVDSRPEMGVWAGGAAWIDTNGNTTFDPTNPDFTNRDITYVLGYTSDNLFAGNFAAETDDLDTPNVNETIADGFDKLAAYGRVGTSTFRWLIDTDNDGVPDIERVDPANVNGYPVAGNFAAFSGDEVGLFAGNRWHFDTNHNFQVDTQIAWPVAGAPIVGDFDGDGFDDLATFVDDVFSVDLSSLGAAGPVAALNNGGLGTGVNGTIDRTFKFGFIGVGEKPVAADMNQDGIEDIGLWVPARDGVPPAEGAEWYFLISGVTANNTPPAAAPPNPAIGVAIGPTITGTGDPTPGDYLASGTGFYDLPTAPGVNPIYANGRIVRDVLFPGANVVRFDPSPFGNDLFMQFGNEFALPILGNFDPPVSRGAALPTATNPRNVMDVNNDGHVTAADALIIIDSLNAHGTTQVPTSGFVGAPFMDIDGNRYVSPADALMVIDRLNVLDGEGEGEAADAFFSDLAADQGEGEHDDLLALLAMDAAIQKKKK